MDGFPPFPPPLGNRYAIPTVPQPDDDDDSTPLHHQGDISTWLTLGHFHWAYDNGRHCCQILLDKPRRVQYNFRGGRSLSENLTAVVQPHEPLVAALRSREGQAIAEAVREHIELSYGRYISSDGRAVKSFRDAEACRRRNRRFPEVD